MVGPGHNSDGLRHTGAEPADVDEGVVPQRRGLPLAAVPQTDGPAVRAGAAAGAGDDAPFPAQPHAGPHGRLLHRARS